MGFYGKLAATRTAIYRRILAVHAIIISVWQISLQNQASVEATVSTVVAFAELPRHEISTKNIFSKAS